MCPFRRRQIAACITSALALAAPAPALAITVGSCLDDGGPNTLRSVIAAAVDGATIDFVGLDCSAVASKITLAGSPITISQQSLTLDGSGATARLAVDASGLTRTDSDHRAFTHTGIGTLSVSHIDVTGGYVLHSSTPSKGGCILSEGSVSLNDAVVSNCTVKNSGYFYYALGGAIGALGDVTLQSSTVSHSVASGSIGARGGGIFAANVTLANSTVSHNTAGSSVTGARGGGVYAEGNLGVTYLSFLGYNTVNAVGEADGGGAYVHGDFTNGNDTFGAFIYRNSVIATNGKAKGGGAQTGGKFISNHVPTHVTYNSATANGFNIAAGGGLYVTSDLTFYLGSLSGNTAVGAASNGGGAYVLGQTTVGYMTVSNNAANAANNNIGYGGGLWLGGGATIVHSTISGNAAGNGTGGGISNIVKPSAQTLTIDSSTISGNTAAGLTGGLFSNLANVKIYNSTIAFNIAVRQAFGSTPYSPGVHLAGPSTVLLQNTLIANNYVGTSEDDLTIETLSGAVTFDAASSTNLIRATSVTLPPGSTTFGACPLLGRLRDNGGLTATHALMSTSPAIDHGGPSNSNSSYDQRGRQVVNKTADYPRVSGPIGNPSPIADIGAYEVQQTDTIFDTEFEGCNPLP